MDASITIDVEQDCPPFLRSYRGLEEGVPRLLALLAEEDVAATFFATGETARRFPDRVRRIVDLGHELGCHGDTHARFSRLGPAAARREIDVASSTLRAFGEVTSFRAPNLDFPDSYLPFLRDAGYCLDSSEGRHKPSGWGRRDRVVDGIRRVPVAISPSALRLPGPIRRLVLDRIGAAPVLFFHPWEFVDLRRTAIPLDCRFATGEGALRSLRAVIGDLRDRGATFVRLCDRA